MEKVPRALWLIRGKVGLEPRRLGLYAAASEAAVLLQEEGSADTGLPLLITHCVMFIVT